MTQKNRHSEITKNYSDTPSWQLYLGALLVGAVWVLAGLVTKPSQDTHNFLFGYSLPILVMIGILVAIIIAISILLYRLHRQPSLLTPISNFISSVYKNPKYRLFVIILLTLLLAAGIILLAIIHKPAGGYTPLHSLVFSITQRLNAFVIWMIVLSVQTGILFIVVGKNQQLALSAKKISLPSINKLIIVFLLGLFALSMAFFTLLIIFLLMSNYSIEVIAPFWFYGQIEEPMPLPLGAIVGVLAFTAFAVLGITRLPAKYRLAAIFLLGVLLQIIFPVIVGQGFTRFSYRLSHSGTGQYIQTACSQTPLPILFQEYETLAEGNKWLLTKPPGHLLPFYFLRGILSTVQPTASASQQGLQQLMITTLTYLSPLLAMLALLPLNSLSGYFLNKNTRYLPSLIYILLPNTVLMAARIDQFLIPTLFLVTALLVVKSVRNHSIWLLALTGLWLSLTFGYSFSLLPSAALFYLCIGMDYLLEKTNRDIKRSLTTALVTTAAMTFGIFAQELGSDLLNRFSAAMASNRTQIGIDEPLAQLWQDISINLFEYIFWIGPPVLILISIGIIGRLLKKKQIITTPKDVWLAVSGIFFLLLLLSGQNRAEVARLWIFLNPLFAIAASLYLAGYSKKAQVTMLVVFTIIQITLIALYNQSFQHGFFTVLF